MKKGEYTLTLSLEILCSFVISIVILSPFKVLAATTGDTIYTIADALEQAQIKEGVNSGIWPFEAHFTGSISAGLAKAYQCTCNEVFKESAELGAESILHDPHAGYGDETYAMMLLSECSSDPANNSWRTIVENFFQNISNYNPGGTAGYINYFYEGTEPSTAVLYIAYNLVAAHYVDADDLPLWRESLIYYLSRVSDESSQFPVMALGIATWALSKTGKMDETPVGGGDGSAPYWDTITLEQLPELLASHQVPDGPYAGCFYWQFNPDPESINCGYIEDTLYSLLGLATAHKNGHGVFTKEIHAGRKVLLDNIGIGLDGTVYGHLWFGGARYYAYAGETLQVLGELILPGDMDLNDTVDLCDYAILADLWANPAEQCSLSKADLDKNGEVDFSDLAIFTANFMNGVDK